MKKIIFCFILIFYSSISFAEFDYSKGMTFNNCKVKIISITNSTFGNTSMMLESRINDFCERKTVYDIKFQETTEFMSVIIIYK